METKLIPYFFYLNNMLEYLDLTVKAQKDQPKLELCGYIIALLLLSCAVLLVR